MAFSGGSWGDRQCDRNWKAQRFGLYLIYNNTGMVEDAAGVHHQLHTSTTISELRQEFRGSKCRPWSECGLEIGKLIRRLEKYNGEHDYLVVKVDEHGQHIIEDLNCVCLEVLRFNDGQDNINYSGEKTAELLARSISLGLK